MLRQVAAAVTALDEGTGDPTVASDVMGLLAQVFRRAEGRKEGREEGMRQLLLYQLEQRFGLLPEIVRLKVEAIDSPRRLTRLSGQVLVASSLEELGLR
jgi:hypothetical protein